MFEHGKKRSKKSLLKKLAITMVIVTVLLVGAAGYGFFWYKSNLKPISGTSKIIEVTIEPGTTTGEIATLLEEKGVIKSAFAFEIYARVTEKRSQLKAGIYELDPSFSTEKIVSIITDGKIVTDTFTITPGLRIDQIERLFIQAGFDKEEVASALLASNYKDHPALVDKPAKATLEGYLFPETFQITPSDTPKDIIERSLDEMAKQFTPDAVAAWKALGLDTYKAITLASIIEMEVPGEEDRRTVAQVFLKRLDEGIELGSDVTYYYAAALTGEEPYPGLESPYNTRIYQGLPPGPIANPGITSITALANPTDTDYLFFVAGEDGNTYFADTNDEHEANIQKYCKSLCEL